MVDPTGCGDTFAGTLATYLAAGSGPIAIDELRNALIHATVSASFTLQGFGIKGLQSMTLESYEQRLNEYMFNLRNVSRYDVDPTDCFALEQPLEIL